MAGESNTSGEPATQDDETSSHDVDSDTSTTTVNATVLDNSDAMNVVDVCEGTTLSLPRSILVTYASERETVDTELFNALQMGELADSQGSAIELSSGPRAIILLAMLARATRPRAPLAPASLLTRCLDGVGVFRFACDSRCGCRSGHCHAHLVSAVPRRRKA